MRFSRSCPRHHRSDLAQLLLAAGLVTALAGCGGIAGLDTFTGSQASTASAGAGSVIGTGPVRVGLILPLSAANGAMPALAIRNAAELAIAEFQSKDITILVKDDGGTPDGAAAAVRQALGEGAEIILGPLFAQSVQAAAPVVRGAGKPMIAFSSDQSVAAKGVYLLSFLPQSDIDRVIDYAGSKGKKSIAILAPQNAYGDVATQDIQIAVGRLGARIAAIERYQPGQATAAAQRLKASVASADALFIAEDAANLAAAAQALGAAGIKRTDIQFLGTSLWNQASVFKLPALQGAWFAAPEADGFASFAARYKAKFGESPTRIATLGFDAAALLAALSKTQGTQRFEERVLTNPSGFAGQDGVFRFRVDGTSDRALAVYEIKANKASIASPAPKSFRQ